MESTRVINKNLHNLEVFHFGLGNFKRCNTYGSSLVMTFEFSRISKTWSSVEYLQSHFLNHTLLVFLGFFLQQTTNIKIDLLFLVLRYPTQCTSLELLPEPLQIKICYRLCWKCTHFSCFAVICWSAIWKSLFLQNRSWLCHLRYVEGGWLNSIPTFCQQLLLCVDYPVLHSMKV